MATNFKKKLEDGIYPVGQINTVSALDKPYGASASGGTGPEGYGNGAKKQYGAQSFDSNIDYATLLNDMMAGGAEKSLVKDTLESRVAKANGTPGLEKYAADDVYHSAIAYLTGKGSKAGDFSYEEAPQYASKYQNQIDNLTNQLLGMNYNDWAKGEDYRQLEGRYQKNGQTAMDDTLGQVAARTGGMASSYATSAAAAQYNSLMQQLEQAAREMYQSERGNKQDDLSMLMGLDGADYGKYQDSLGQYNTDRNFDYGMHLDNRDYNYQLGRDEIADGRYAQEYGDNRGDVEYEKQLRQAETLAAYGDFSGYKALGYDEAQIARMQAANQLQQAASAGGRSGGSGGSGGSGSAKSSGILDAMLNLGDDDKAFEYLLGQKLTQTNFDAMWARYQEKAAAPKDNGYVSMADLNAQSNGSGSGQKNSYSSGYDTAWNTSFRKLEEGASINGIIEYLIKQGESGNISAEEQDDIIRRLNLK